jgi:hypothetical protein
MEEMEELIQNGTIWDGMTLAAWAIAKPKLFSAISDQRLMSLS